MMEKAAGEDEISGEERERAAPSAPAPRKRTRAAITDGGASFARICDDVAVNILARLPARAAVACTALSKHHGGLIRSQEFRSLHRRLGAPLPRPHIAYVATAPIKRRPDQEDPVSVFHGFHLAGAGLGGGAPTPMRALTGWRHRGTEYVGTCNGVVLLASAEFSAPCRCTLWNPAVADVARDVTVPEPSLVSKCLVLGLGYGRRSKTYKILVCRKDFHPTSRTFPTRSGRGMIRLSCGGGGGGQTHRIEYSLAVHSLGDVDKQTPPRTVLSAGVDEGIKQKSLYIDGTIYLVHLGQSAPTFLAFDVDDETVSRLDMPSEREQERRYRRGTSGLELFEMSGRPCLVTLDEDRRCVAMWLLAAADRRWERVCVISDQDRTVFYRIIGVWDCGGVLVRFELYKVFLYDAATKKLFRAEVPDELAEGADCYEICWGYQPTLVSPGSIVGELDNQDLEQRRNRSAHITDVINLLGPLDRRIGQKATLNTVCLMEFLVRIMQKLPRDLQDVVEMPGVDSEDPAGFLFESSVCSD